MLCQKAIWTRNVSSFLSLQILPGLLRFSSIFSFGFNSRIRSNLLLYFNQHRLFGNNWKLKIPIFILSVLHRLQFHCDENDSSPPLKLPSRPVSCIKAAMESQTIKSSRGQVSTMWFTIRSSAWTINVSFVSDAHIQRINNNSAKCCRFRKSKTKATKVLLSSSMGISREWTRFTFKIDARMQNLLI